MQRYKKGDRVILAKDYSSWPDTKNAIRDGVLILNKIYTVIGYQESYDDLGPTVWFESETNGLWGLGADAVVPAFEDRVTKWDWLA